METRIKLGLCIYFLKFLSKQNYFILNMRSCVNNIMCCDSLDSSPQHYGNPFDSWEMLQYPNDNSTQSLKNVHSSSTHLSSNYKTKKDAKVKKSLKRQIPQQKIPLRKIQSQPCLNYQSDPYLLRETLGVMPPKTAHYNCSKPALYKQTPTPPQPTSQLVYSPNHVGIPNFRKIHSQTPRIKFIFQNPQADKNQPEQNSVSEVKLLQKSKSIHNLLKIQEKGLKSSYNSKSQASLNCHLNIHEISFKDVQNPPKSTITRNPEDPTTDHQLSLQNTHLFNFARDAHKKMLVHKSAINLEEFRCVRAQSIGASSDSSDRYSEVVFRTGERRERCVSKRTSLAEKSRSKSKGKSKFYVNTSSQKQIRPQKTSNTLQQQKSQS